MTTNQKVARSSRAGRINESIDLGALEGAPKFLLPQKLPPECLISYAVYPDNPEGKPEHLEVVILVSNYLLAAAGLSAGKKVSLSTFGGRGALVESHGGIRLREYENGYPIVEFVYRPHLPRLRERHWLEVLAVTPSHITFNFPV